MNDKTRRILDNFIEKAHKLRQFEFYEHVREIGFGFRTSRDNDGGWDTEFSLPDEQKRDAFLLTFRLFIQQNEDISFHRLKSILDDSGISEEFKTGITDANHTYFKYLKGHPENIKPGFFEEGVHPTREEIMQVVMYGDLAHTNNPNRRLKYMLWTRDEIRKSVLLQVFTRTVVNIFKLIYRVAELSKSELANSVANSTTLPSVRTSLSFIGMLR